MPHTPPCRPVIDVALPPIPTLPPTPVPTLARAFVATIMGGMLLFPGLLYAAETLFWPISGHLRDSPALMDTALHADGPAGNMIIVQADVPGDVAGAVVSQPPAPKGTPPPKEASATKGALTTRSATTHTPANAQSQATTQSQGSARRNTVILQRGVVYGYADGGWSDMGPAQDNILIVSGGTVRKLARGGGSNGGPTEGNVLHITDGSVEGSAYGGSSLHDRASGNVLTFSGGVVRDAIVGGSSRFGQALGNAVRMGGGRVTSVLGGSSGHNDALGNTVQVLGGVVEGDIVGGETMDGELATQNTVSIGPQAQLARSVSIFGGLRTGSVTAGTAAPSPTPSPDQRTGNVLHMLGWSGKLRGIHNFQYVNFSLPETIKPGDTVLHVEEEVNLHDAVLRLTGALPAGLKAGDSVTLLRAPSLHVTGLRLAPGSLPSGSRKNHKNNTPTAEFTLSLDNAAKPTAILMTLKHTAP